MESLLTLDEASGGPSITCTIVVNYSHYKAVESNLNYKAVESNLDYPSTFP